MGPQARRRQGLIGFRILQDIHNSLGRKSMANRIASGLLLPRLGFWPRALYRIAAIGFDLFKRGHGVLLSDLASLRNFDPARRSNDRGQFCSGLAATDVF
jgi:hypothetical protein